MVHSCMSCTSAVRRVPRRPLLIIVPWQRSGILPAFVSASVGRMGRRGAVYPAFVLGGPQCLACRERLSRRVETGDEPAGWRRRGPGSPLQATLAGACSLSDTLHGSISRPLHPSGATTGDGVWRRGRARTTRVNTWGRVAQVFACTECRPAGVHNQLCVCR